MSQTAVNVTIATRPNEISNVQITLLRHHVRQQCVAGNVEGHSQKRIRAALVQLTTQFSFRHIKLKQTMAGRKSHVLNE